MSSAPASPYVAQVNKWLDDDPIVSEPLVAATSIGVSTFSLGFVAGVGLLMVALSGIGVTDWIETDWYRILVFMTTVPAGGLIGVQAVTVVSSRRWLRVFGVLPASSMVLGLTADRLLIWRSDAFRTPKLTLLVNLPREGISATKPGGLAGLTLHFPNGLTLSLSSSRSFSLETRRVIAELNASSSTTGALLADIPRFRPADELPNPRRVWILTGAIVLLGGLATFMGAWDSSDSPQRPDYSNCVQAPTAVTRAISKRTPHLDELWMELRPADPSKPDTSAMTVATTLNYDGVLSFGSWFVEIDRDTESVTAIYSIGAMTSVRSNWPEAPSDLSIDTAASLESQSAAMCASSVLYEAD